MGFLKGPYKYVQVSTLRIAIKAQLTSSVAVELSQVGPTCDAVRESDGDVTVTTPYLHSHYDRKIDKNS